MRAVHWATNLGGFFNSPACGVQTKHGFRCTNESSSITCKKCRKRADQAHEGATSAIAAVFRPRPISEYHEDMGPVLWWKFPIVEEPYVGGPNDLGYGVQVAFQSTDGGSHAFDTNVGGWPGYHTHFTMIPKVEEPK